jgi:hypothetical protein
MKLTFYRGTHGILLCTPELFRGTKELPAMLGKNYKRKQINKK